jgi:hypothetical protein
MACNGDRLVELFRAPLLLPGLIRHTVTHGQEFRHVWDCHVLEHEDNEMMRPYNALASIPAAIPRKLRALQNLVRFCDTWSHYFYPNHLGL